MRLFYEAFILIWIYLHATFHLGSSRKWFSMILVWNCFKMSSVWWPGLFLTSELPGMQLTCVWSRSGSQGMGRELPRWDLAQRRAVLRVAAFAALGGECWSSPAVFAQLFWGISPLKQPCDVNTQTFYSLVHLSDFCSLHGKQCLCPFSVSMWNYTYVLHCDKQKWALAPYKFCLKWMVWVTDR